MAKQKLQQPKNTKLAPGDKFNMATSDDRGIFSTGHLAVVYIWLEICLRFLSACLTKLSEIVPVQQKIHSRQASHVDIQSGEMIDAFQKGDVQVCRHENKTDQKSAAPLITTVLQLVPAPSENADDEVCILRDAGEVAQLFVECINETQYITIIFESQTLRLAQLLADLDTEMQRWFEATGGLAVACEVTWSVPISKRQRQTEMQLKTKLGRALRTNNRRVMDVKNTDLSCPLAIAEATTKESSNKTSELNTFQGVFKRYHSELLPLQHRQTSSAHEAYWYLDTSVADIRPQQYLLGTNRRADELRDTCLLALHMIVLNVNDE